MNVIHRNSRMGRFVGAASLWSRSSCSWSRASRSRSRSPSRSTRPSVVRCCTRTRCCTTRSALRSCRRRSPGRPTGTSTPTFKVRCSPTPVSRRVRLWAADGTLLFSTDERDKIGELRVKEDPAITAAPRARFRAVYDRAVHEGYHGRPRHPDRPVPDLRAAPRPRSDRGARCRPDRPVLRLALTAAAGPWKTAQMIFLALTVLFAALAIVSFRRRPVAVPVPAEASGFDTVVSDAPVAATAEMERHHREELAALAASEVGRGRHRRLAVRPGGRPHAPQRGSGANGRGAHHEAHCGDHGGLGCGARAAAGWRDRPLSATRPPSGRLPRNDRRPRPRARSTTPNVARRMPSCASRTWRSTRGSAAGGRGSGR